MTISEKKEFKNKSSGKPFKSILSFSLTFILMFGLWVILSGNFEPLLIFLGLFSSFLCAFFFKDLLFSDPDSDFLLIMFRFFKYIPWLIFEIIKANFHLLYLVFHPRMKDMIDPHVVVIKTGLKKEMSIVTMANSITLTPGTITINADREGVFKVHSIDKESAEALPGTMLKKTARIFGEDK
ncbi:MAG: cation:proton antiporter [Desulfobacteraceae bacterium 4572_130]|nr:MAG: cation:proton antiporter [Desulfobacteraceae bacterium 4572_130]